MVDEVLYVAELSDVGQERRRNEDSVLTLRREEDSSWLLVVCDGMGGHQAGDVASRVASEALRESLLEADPADPVTALNDALLHADLRVQEEAHHELEGRPGAQGMGSTAVVAWVLGNALWVGWVGDSRLYVFREGRLLRRSTDHTRVQMLLDRGFITPEEAEQRLDGHVLMQAIGGHGELAPGVWEEPLELQTGDVLLLCSDGLTDRVEDEELYPLIGGRSVEGAARQLVSVANKRGGLDNITVVVACQGQERLPSPPPGSGRRLPEWVGPTVLVAALGLLGVGLALLLR